MLVEEVVDHPVQAFALGGGVEPAVADGGVLGHCLADVGFDVGGCAPAVLVAHQPMPLVVLGDRRDPVELGVFADLAAGAPV